MAGLIVHEWIAPHGGSENVAEAMARAYPDAEILSLWNDAPARFPGRVVRESWLAKTPLRKSKAAALPLMPTTWARTDVSAHDFVLVSSHLFAHHVGGAVRADGPPKYVYVHTPARYIWTPELDARGDNLLAKALARPLKRIDKLRAADGAVFAANSAFVRERIRSTWDQDAIVIHPPVDVSRLQSVDAWESQLSLDELAILKSLPSEFVLGASRFVPYKRLDVVISAGEAARLPVVLAGSGPMKAELEAAGAAAAVPVTLVDRPSDALLYALYEAASVFVFPAVEDFGIMPVEAMSLGTPTVVSAEGGARESVDALAGGAVVEDFNSSSLAAGIDSALSADMNAARGRARAEFGEATFASRLTTWMDTHALR